MKRNDHDHVTETTTPANKPANDNGTTTTSVAALKGSTALMSLEALATALNGIDTGGRSGKPLMLFKARDNTWVYGRNQTEPEEGSRWVVNPMTFERGQVAFRGKEKLGERMRSVSLPEIDPADLPDVGAPWQPQMSFEMKCLDGTDAGVEVVLKSNTDGGISAILGLIDNVRSRLNAGQHNGDIAPILTLGKGGYPHPQYGWTNTPLLTDVGWMSMSGPAPKPAPASPPPPKPPGATTAANDNPQPRRRRPVG
jgi:hypothetical protein